MKTNIGGDRLGSGNKEEVVMKHYNRSNHDLGSTWRSSMAAGTLVPFLSLPAQSGDRWDIDLACEVITLPTVGPMFGSFKVQLDVFQIPIRIYNAMLHMNRLEIGNDMSQVLLPLKAISWTYDDTDEEPFRDNNQVSSSALVRYLGISGIGTTPLTEGAYYRFFNAVPFLGYWDIYKNYYANKQEEVGYCIHTDNDSIVVDVSQMYVITASTGAIIGNILDTSILNGSESGRGLKVFFPSGTPEIDPSTVNWVRGGAPVDLASEFTTVTWDPEEFTLTTNAISSPSSSVTWSSSSPTGTPINPASGPFITSFPLNNIDDMRMSILQHTPQTTAFIINSDSPAPYGHESKFTGPVGGFTKKFSASYSQENLGLKTYQSDLFNNWISTEWLDGPNGVNEITAVDTTGDSFTIDSLNLAQKVYNMLNRIAISGGSYDDWLDAVFEHERPKSMEEPVYHGSLIKELQFEEVISTAATDTGGNAQPLGELGGRGRLTQKNKGGKIKISVHEPSYIMGIVSLTPRIEYSQGNQWDVNLRTMDDFHKPALDGIGFQELIVEQMAWQTTTLSASDTFTYESAGKQPAWINYMTDVNKSFGNFAEVDKDMFMVLNRRYDINPFSGDILDLTTYIDPSKYNYIFAQTDLEAMNFWVHIGKQINVRRKISAKQIPNL